MKIHHFLAAILLTMCLSSLHAQELSDVLPIDPAVRTGTLPNGLRYYIRKNHKPENRAEFRLAVKTGSVMEDDDQQGLAHFCEHMQFNGTKHFPKADLVNFLESTGVRFGAHLNAYTSFDETVYMLQLPMDKADMLGKGLLVLEDWAGNASFDDVEIDKERGVVIEEWRLGRGAGERIQNKHLPIELYQSHYADRLPIGTKEILEKFSHETIRRFYHDWYRPDLMAVMAVGDFDLDKMESEIKTRFAKLQNPPNEKPRTKYKVPLHNNLLISIAGDKEYPSQSATVMFERPKESEVSVADYRSQLVNGLYDAMLNARLQELLQKGNPPFTFGGAGDGNFLGDLNAYQAFAALKPDAIESGLKALLAELYRVKQNGFTATELEREKKQMLTNMEESYKERDKTESGNYVGEYLRNFLNSEPFPGLEYEFKLYNKFVPTISLSEVNALSTKRMDAGSRVITISYSEKEGAAKPPTEDQIRKLFEEASQSHQVAYDDKVSDKPLLAKIPTPGKIVSEKKTDDLGITEWTLSNGAHVILKPTDFKNDQILFSANAPGGSSLASDDDYLAAGSASRIIDECGIGDVDATMLTKMLAGKNVSMRPNISELQEGFFGSTTPKDQETMFQLLYLYATSPRKDEAAFTAIREKMLAGLKQRDASPTTAYSDTLSNTMTQYHYRTRPMKTSMVDEITLDKAYTFYKSRFSDFGHFTFYLVGNLDMPKMRELCETYIASLPSSSNHETWKDLGITPPKGNIVKNVYKGIEPKSNVTINITGPFEWNPKNRFDIQAMAEVINIKLRETLREDKGGVYGVGVNASPTHYPHERYQLSIRFGCAPDRVQELVDETMKKLDTMVIHPPEETYVNKVREIQKHELEVALKENSFWLSSLAQLHFNGEDPHAIFKRSDLIAHMNADDIFTAAKKYCKRENMVEVILYPETKK
ncbi:MAG: insulinase family protein [bacterium]